jgi:hypothetical protein
MSNRKRHTDRERERNKRPIKSERHTGLQRERDIDLT